MFKKLKTVVLTFTLVSALVGIVSVSPVAAAGALKTDACAGLSQVDPSQGCGSNSGGTINTVIKAALNILSVVVGVVAVVMVVISGLRFITAQGDASSVASARSGLIYALVGLSVAALAQLIVHYVMGKV
jgi:hypothetical protein